MSLVQLYFAGLGPAELSARDAEAAVNAGQIIRCHLGVGQGQVSHFPQGNIKDTHLVHTRNDSLLFARGMA